LVVQTGWAWGERASAAAAMCALGAMVVQIAFEAPDAPDSLLERWIEAVTGDIL